ERVFPFVFKLAQLARLIAGFGKTDERIRAEPHVAALAVDLIAQHPASGAAGGYAHVEPGPVMKDRRAFRFVDLRRRELADARHWGKWGIPSPFIPPFCLRLRDTSSDERKRNRSGKREKTLSFETG